MGSSFKRHLVINRFRMEFIQGTAIVRKHPMSLQSKWFAHSLEHKTFFYIIAIGLFFVEIEILAIAITKSGRETHMHITDHQDNLVYMVKSNKLDETEKAYFEKTFGPLTNFQVNIVTKDRPFPIRAWLAAAVGIPIGIVLIFGFYLKAYEALFIKNGAAEETEFTGGSPLPAGSRLETLFVRISRMNIFAMGAFILLLVLGLWAVPSILTEFGQHGVATIVRYKWATLTIALIGLGLFIWIIYLRYLLARKAIETRAEVEKYRFELEMSENRKHMPLLTSSAPEYLEGGAHDDTLEEIPAPKENGDRT